MSTEPVKLYAVFRKFEGTPHGLKLEFLSAFISGPSSKGLVLRFSRTSFVLIFGRSGGSS